MKKFSGVEERTTKDHFTLDTPDYVESAELSGTAVQTWS